MFDLIVLAPLACGDVRYFGITKTSKDTKDWLLPVDDKTYNDLIEKEYKKKGEEGTI